MLDHAFEQLRSLGRSENSGKTEISRLRRSNAEKTRQHRDEAQKLYCTGAAFYAQGLHYAPQALPSAHRNVILMPGPARACILLHRHCIVLLRHCSRMQSAGVLGGAARLHTLPLWARLTAVPSLLRSQRQITFDKHNGFVSLSPALTSIWPAPTCAFKCTGQR